MAGMKQQTRKIGSSEYRVTQLPFGKAREMFVKLFRILGPVLGEALLSPGSATGAAALASMTGSTLGNILKQMPALITEEDLKDFCQVFGEKTQLIRDDGKTPWLTAELQETHFAGGMLEMFKWLAFCVEVNFGDFFAVGGLRNAGASQSAPESALQ